MATSTYYKKDDFIKWLEDPKGGNLRRPRQYAGYIGSILDNVLEPLGCGVLIKDIEPAIRYRYSYKKVFEGLDEIYSYLKRLVWISDNFKNNAKINQYIATYKLNKNSINNWPTAIIKYKEFLEGLQIQTSASPKHKYLTRNGWDEAIKKLKQGVKDILTSKGTDNIVAVLGGEFDQFYIKRFIFFYFFICA